MKRRNKVLYRSDGVSAARCLTSPRIGRSRRVECSRPSTSTYEPNFWSNETSLGGPQDELGLSAQWLRWIVYEAKVRGIALQGAEEEETGGWNICSPSALLALTDTSSTRVWVSQRTGCSGYITTVQFTDSMGRFGAWIVDRPFGQTEPEAWRALLLEALVLSKRQ